MNETPQTKPIFGGGAIRSRAPFRDSLTATRRPKVLPPPQEEEGEKKPGIIGKVLSVFGGKETSPRERELQDQEQEIEAERARIRQIADRLATLTAERDRAAQKLAQADAQFEELKAQRAAMAERVKVAAWGNSPHRYGHAADSPALFYGNFAAADHAIADYPRCREPLAAAAATAEAALKRFQEENELDA